MYLDLYLGYSLCGYGVGCVDVVAVLLRCVVLEMCCSLLGTWLRVCG